MEFTVLALAFATIFVVELPDKTFIATLVMSTRMRPLLVWIGVGCAFFVQTLVAVALGTAAGLLPQTPVHMLAAAMFLIGAVLLLRSAPGADAHEARQEQEYAERAGAARGMKVVATSFLVIFAAEWGDLSQVLTASLVAKYDDPLAVFLGAWTALLTVSGLAVLLGRVLLRYVKLSVLHYVGALVCLLIAALILYELVN